MSNRMMVVLAVLCATAAPVSTAAAQSRASDAEWEVPRTVDGRPDFQGNWSNSTLTPFQRTGDRGPVYTPEEVAEREQTDGNCPANPGTVMCGRTERTSGSNEARLSGVEYNEVYWERGSRVADRLRDFPAQPGSATPVLRVRIARGRIAADSNLRRDSATRDLSRSENAHATVEVV